jgi:4'-phosphopantetheinyl transferase
MPTPSQPEVLTAGLDAAPEELGALWLCLSPAERSRAARFRFERERTRYVAARARLRMFLGARLGAAPEAIELVEGRAGKPALGGAFARSGWRFNLAHSEALAVYAFCRTREVGVDVEALRTPPDADRLAASAFSARELQAYRAAPAPRRPLAFLRLWTRKEALAKALGDGFSAPPESLDTARAKRAGWRLESFLPRPGFIAALAVQIA